MFLATDEFHGCCSNACLDQLMGYMADVEEFYKSDHAAHWTEVQ
jgi:hypothetical protein